MSGSGDTVSSFGKPCVAGASAGGVWWIDGLEWAVFGDRYRGGGWVVGGWVKSGESFALAGANAEWRLVAYWFGMGCFLGIGIGAGGWVVGGWAKSGESFALAGANAGGVWWIDCFGKAFK